MNKDIFDIEKYPEDELLIEDAPIGWYGLVSYKIVREGLPIRFMYREKQGKLSIDSGWRLFSGTEDQEFLDNPENYSFYSLTRIVNYQPNTSGLFWEEVGSVFEIKEGESEFSRVTDWEPPVE